MAGELAEIDTPTHGTLRIRAPAQALNRRGLHVQPASHHLLLINALWSHIVRKGKKKERPAGLRTRRPMQHLTAPRDSMPLLPTWPSDLIDVVLDRARQLLLATACAQTRLGTRGERERTA